MGSFFTLGVESLEFLVKSSSKSSGIESSLQTSFKTSTGETSVTVSFSGKVTAAFNVEDMFVLASKFTAGVEVTVTLASSLVPTPGKENEYELISQCKYFLRY